MAAPRNIAAALGIVRDAVKAALEDVTRDYFEVDYLIAQSRLRNPPALAPFNDAEVHELIDLALAHKKLPAGAVGEAVLAYLCAGRTDRPSLDVIAETLGRFDADADEGFDAVSAWLRGASAHQFAQADMLQAERARKWGAA